MRMIPMSASTHITGNWNLFRYVIGQTPVVSHAQCVENEVTVSRRRVS
jgi:hypothetical protein